MIRLSRYLIPACLAAFGFGLLFMFGDVRGKSEQKQHEENDDDNAEDFSVPHGRVLTVVVDEKAVFIGEEPIAV